MKLCKALREALGKVSVRDWPDANISCQRESRARASVVYLGVSITIALLCQNCVFETVFVPWRFNMKILTFQCDHSLGEKHGGEGRLEA